MELSLEILKDPVFWSDVGLTTASRLAIAAMLLWVMKVMFDRQFDRHSIPRLTVSATPTRDEPPVANTRIALYRGPESRANVTAPQPSEIPSNRRRDELRDRLLKYVEQRSTERMSR